MVQPLADQKSQTKPLAKSSESNTPAEGDETATDDGGSVLGAATETLTSFLSRFGLPIGVGLVVLAGLYVIFFYKRDEKQPTKRSLTTIIGLLLLLFGIGTLSYSYGPRFMLKRVIR